ncbi:MAG: cyclopropane-fatty-acyl-phospholipid synthase [Verrucomicrobiales bacterium]|nr:cyclopropane-fatty-acyl-phospholipid synthase [Verrucomicrobiales bacterium]
MNDKLNPFFSGILFKVLSSFNQGELRLTLPDGTSHCYGNGDGAPRAEIQVKDPEFFRKCVLHGNVGLGEAYVLGHWETPDIRAVIEWFAINVASQKDAKGVAVQEKMVGFLRLFDRMSHLKRKNTRDGSRRNIEEHYDLGNDFYRLWLDSSMTYSCARFTDSAESLEEAQNNKYEALCRKLQLKKEDHVLEIGCGWGGFSIYAAGKYGCRITGVTISPAQLEEAVARVKAAGLEDLIELRLQDYRDIEGQFDKIASIEMLEAVGDEHLKTWCQKVNEVLKPNGLVAVQMITVADRDHKTLRKGTDFIQKHIFPGSLLLSVGRMNEAFNATGDLFLHGLEDMGTSYHRTLRHWYENFNGRLAEVKALGFDEQFVRKWNYYLKYCEAGFSARTISVVQGVYTRPYNAAELTKENGVAII